MQKVFRRLERWRSRRRGRTLVPKPLWASGQSRRGGGNTGFFEHRRYLHLEFNRLKEFAHGSKTRKRTTAPPAQFVELMTAPPAGVSECVIELEGRRGKMRIQWKGVTAS